MSSYISSLYQIEYRRRQAIVGQCQRELWQAQQAAAKNRAAWKAMLDNRTRKQVQLAEQEQRLSDEATAQVLRADAQRKARAGQVQRLLHCAEEEVQRCENAGANGVLRERLQTMQNAVSLFGATQQIQQQLELFLQQEIPAAREQVLQDAEQRRMEQVMQQKLPVPSNVHDASIQFVSLQTTGQAGLEPYTSPWQAFVQRLQMLRLEQETLGETRAGEILAEAEKTEAGQRNLFLLKHQAEVEALERSYAGLQEACRMRQEQRQQLQDRYLALCVLCQVRPTLPDDAAETQLERECGVLLAQYQKEKERQYVTNAFSEVLGSFGIEFESMHTDTNGQMQMQYHISTQAALQITRSDAGAFEMQFAGMTEGEQASLDEKRQAVEQAHAFCKRLPEIAAALRERGIVFDQVAVQQPTEETVAMVSEKGRNRIVRKQKAREMQ